MIQKVITNKDSYIGLDDWIEESQIQKPLLICGSSLKYQKKLVDHLNYLKNLGVEFVVFSDYEPNPKFESVVDGVHLFKKNSCDGIIAIGGGSAMDVAKCIKLFSNMDDKKNYLIQEIIPNTIPFLAVPTTAGTGSEATRYAVIYYNGEKQSISHDSCIPDIVLMDHSLLSSLPTYQKKATMMDALSHSIESFWSINSTIDSKKYSMVALKCILDNMEGYLANNDIGNERMLMAANIAGRAINITQTTAGHAMSYKLTSMFGIAHGHATILCNKVIYRWMIENTSKCIDKRGEAYLRNVLDEIGVIFGGKDAISGANKLEQIVDNLGLDIPRVTEEQLEELRKSVNIERLKNFPIRLDEKTIDALYREILRK